MIPEIALRFAGLYRRFLISDQRGLGWDLTSLKGGRSRLLHCDQRELPDGAILEGLFWAESVKALAVKA